VARGAGDAVAAELAAKPVYTQFRVIGIADGGREIVRVDRSGPHGAIRNVPDGELQRKADSYYSNRRSVFPRAPSMFLRSTSIEDMASSRCRMYRRCGLRPQFTRAMTARSAFSSSISICGRYSDLVRAATNESWRIYVVNDRGDFLVAPDRNREFGFEFDKPFLWQHEFPEFAAALGSATEGVGVIKDVTGNRVGAAMSSVQLAAGPRIGVIETISFSALVAPATAAERSSLVVGSLAVWGRSCWRPRWPAR